MSVAARWRAAWATIICMVASRAAAVGAESRVSSSRRALVLLIAAPITASARVGREGPQGSNTTNAASASASSRSRPTKPGLRASLTATARSKRESKSSTEARASASSARLGVTDCVLSMWYSRATNLVPLRMCTPFHAESHENSALLDRGPSGSDGAVAIAFARESATT